MGCGAIPEFRYVSEKELSMLWPSISTSPFDRVSFIVAILKKELLPAPLGPSKPNISPGLIDILTSERAVKLAPNEPFYVLDKLSTSMLLLFKLSSYDLVILSS